jgi:tetratricopeptide (TPR) repeat protein
VAWSEDHAGYEQALEAWAHASAEPSDRFHAALRAGYRAIAGTDEQLAEAVTAAEEFARACPNPSLRIWVDWAAANSARARGRHEQALDGYRRCLDRAEEADHRIMEASAAVLAVVELAEIAGPFDPLEHLRYLEIFDRHRIHLEPGLWFLARHLYSEGHHEQAAIIAGHLIARVAVSFDDEFESVVASTKGSGEWLAYGATLNTDEIIDHTTATLNSLAASDAPTAR